MDTDRDPEVIARDSRRDSSDTVGRRYTLRRIAVGLGVGAVVLVGAGTAAASVDDQGEISDPSSSSSMMNGMRQMHESSAAGEMHERLPPDLRADMEQMHGQMLEMMDSTPGS